MALNTGNHVLGLEGLAIVELDALAQFEAPFLGARLGVPFFGQHGLGLHVAGDAGKAGVAAPGPNPVDVAGHLGLVEGLGIARLNVADLEATALLGRLGEGRAIRHRGGGR